MDVKDNKFMSDNKVQSDNAIANNNQILANNQVNVETRGGIDSLIENTLELICMPVEKYKQIKSGLIAKQLDNFQRILIRAKEIKDVYGIDVITPPLKFSIQFIQQAACEHEEEMYDLWAKLLIEAATDYNPIQLQYADILSKIGSNEAKLLKEVYNKQIQTAISSNLWLVVNQITGGYGQTYRMYYNGETFNRENIIDILYPFDGEKNTSIVLLEKLGLISKFFNQRLSSNRQPNEPAVGLYLTEFGYSMVDCLERKHYATEELSK